MERARVRPMWGTHTMDHDLPAFLLFFKIFILIFEFFVICLESGISPFIIISVIYLKCKVKSSICWFTPQKDLNRCPCGMPVSQEAA